MVKNIEFTITSTAVITKLLVVVEETVFQPTTVSNKHTFKGKVDIVNPVHLIITFNTVAGASVTYSLKVDGKQIAKGSFIHNGGKRTIDLPNLQI